MFNHYCPDEDCELKRVGVYNKANLNTFPSASDLYLYLSIYGVFFKLIKLTADEQSSTLTRNVNDQEVSE